MTWPAPIRILRTLVDFIFPILNDMKSRLAQELRDKQRAEMLALTPGERVQLAVELGETALRNLMSAQGVDRQTARRMTRRGRKAGRKPSSCMDAVDGAD